MTNQPRALTIEELGQIAGGFEEVAHSDMTALQTASQQMSIMMSAVDSVIRGISTR